MPSNPSAGVLYTAWVASEAASNHADDPVHQTYMDSLKHELPMGSHVQLRHAPNLGCMHQVLHSMAGIRPIQVVDPSESNSTTRSKVVINPPGQVYYAAIEMESPCPSAMKKEQKSPIT